MKIENINKLQAVSYSADKSAPVLAFGVIRVQEEIAMTLSLNARCLRLYCNDSKSKCTLFQVVCGQSASGSGANLQANCPA